MFVIGLPSCNLNVPSSANNLKSPCCCSSIINHRCTGAGRNPRLTDAGAKTADQHFSVLSPRCQSGIPLCTVPGFDFLLCVSAPQPPSLLAGTLPLMSIFSISFALSDLSEAVPERYPAWGNGRRCCELPPHPLLAGAVFCCKYWPPPFLAIKGVRWI